MLVLLSKQLPIVFIMLRSTYELLLCRVPSLKHERVQVIVVYLYLIYYYLQRYGNKVHHGRKFCVQK